MTKKAMRQEVNSCHVGLSAREIVEMFWPTFATHIPHRREPVDLELLKKQQPKIIELASRAVNE